MRLGDLTYAQAKGKLYRKEIWGWRDGTRVGGAAYIKEDGKVYFSSNTTPEYDYNRNRNDNDWYEVDKNGYRVPDSCIYIGGE